MADNPAPGMSHNGPVSDIDVLLAEAERHVEYDWRDGEVRCDWCGHDWPCLISRLAAALRSDRTDLLAVMQTAKERGETIRSVCALHHPEQRWRPSPDAEFSFGSREDVIEGWCECGAVCTCEPSSFVICAECGRVESGDDQRPYRESLWPCPTARALGIGGE